MKTPQELGITQEQYDNLEKLAKYLFSNELKAEFSMVHYTGEDKDSELTVCGSIGCAVGHGPYAGIEKYSTEDWGKYARRALGTDLLTTKFFWLFSSFWANRDDTAVGAGKRIKYFLLNGAPTLDSISDQINCRIPLCY